MAFKVEMTTVIKGSRPTKVCSDAMSTRQEAEREIARIISNERREIEQVRKMPRGGENYEVTLKFRVIDTATGRAVHRQKVQL